MFRVPKLRPLMRMRILNRQMAANISLLLCASVTAYFVERTGRLQVPRLKVPSDLTRELGWIAQYGQAVCTFIAAVLIWQLDDRRGRAKCVIATLLATALIANSLKLMTGRIRPNRLDAVAVAHGSTSRLERSSHVSDHESFPSAHAAAAAALTVTLSRFYPRGRGVFWSLTIACAAQRVLSRAHWISDVIAGIALGYIVAKLVGLMSQSMTERSTFPFDLEQTVPGVVAPEASADELPDVKIKA